MRTTRSRKPTDTYPRTKENPTGGNPSQRYDLVYRYDPSGCSSVYPHRRVVTGVRRDAIFAKDDALRLI